MMNKKAITLKDIAKLAGVSHMTVSRAVNLAMRARVAPHTLAMIDKLIRKHNFTANMAARNLRQSATKTIGVIFPYYKGVFYSTYYSHILSGVADFLAGTDYQFKLLLLKDNAVVRDHFNFRATEQIDGLIVTHWTKVFSDKAAIEGINIPMVIINDYEEGVKADIVHGDSYAGGRMCADYLLNKGHRKIAVLNGPGWSRDTHQRLAGFADGLKEKGIELNNALIYRADFIEPDAYNITEKVILEHAGITAIFCCNDEMALGVIRRLKDLNIECPGKISVMGFDNDFKSANAVPALTTINVPVYDLGKQAAEGLINALQGSDVSRVFERITIPVQLIERQSVKAFQL